MKSFIPIFLVFAFVARIDADMGLWLVTKQNITQVKEFSLQAKSNKDGTMEFQISIPYDSRIENIKIEYRRWSEDMSKVLLEQPVDVKKPESGGPWVATVTVGQDVLKDSTIEIFCVRNLPTETAYRIQLASYVEDTGR